MEQNEQHVSTESQRLALEAMSAQLVHKLNAMIREQEERAHAFAAQHHSTLPVPQTISISLPSAPQEEKRPAIPDKPSIPVPPPVAQRPQTPTTPFIAPAPVKKHARQPQKKIEKKTQEDSNIGIGMIIFALVGLFILLRSCT